ncbi:MAG: hypothetical protein M2R45_03099 [Verrucomicrobia subdivision 3 bacterium]|nr:hypothetical protein [Limisphaerales bacterium]MCS1413167.1 hypothetical protein [Limisphaerales bacterium]
MPGYHVFGKGDEMLGGITPPSEGKDVSEWVPYVVVMYLWTGCHIGKVKAKGGTVLCGSDPVPDGGRMAIIGDPAGQSTGLAQYAQGPSSD